MVCFPMTNHAQNLMKKFRRCYEAKTESFFFKDMLPISAETSGGLHINRESNIEKLKVYYRGTAR